MPLACVPILQRWEDDGRHWLLIRRSISDPQEKRYHFVFAPPGTSLQEMVKASGARWHIEEDFANAKDLGLDHYEVRSFVGWYRHSTLVLLALAYLAGICATERSSPVPATAFRPASTAAVLALTVVSRAPSARTAYLARLFVRTSGAGLVVVAPLSPKPCQLLPYKTAPESWLIPASSLFSTAMGCPFALLPDFPDISWK
jgi:hypothetical protein